jgi:hypothetical protein
MADDSENNWTVWAYPALYLATTIGMLVVNLFSTSDRQLS